MSNAARKVSVISDPDPKVKSFTFDQLRTRYTEKAARVVAKCELSTRLVGGMRADRAGVSAFVKSYLKLTGEEADQAIDRILQEEMGVKDTTPPTGELVSSLSSGVNVLRRSEHGPWIKDHMLKACIKNAATRLHVFEKTRAKGDIVEMGEIRALGVSMIDLPERIYLRSKDGKKPIETYFDRFSGNVSTPQGPKSIQTDCECVPPGARFEFEFRYLPTKIKQEDIVDIFACAMIVGVGSAKSFECGKFKILHLEYHDPS